MTIHSLLQRFLAFAAVGAVGTLVHYSLLLAVVEGYAGSPVLGSVLGFCLGALVNYSLSHRLVFRSDKAHREALPRFFAVALSGLAWNALLMALLTRYTPLHYLLAQILVTGLLLLWHFAANALWTFRHPAARDGH